MSQFQFNLPQNMVSTWKTLTTDGNFTAQDQAQLKAVAANHKGSAVQEALEQKALNQIDATLQAHGGSLMHLKSDVLENAAPCGQATVNLEIIDTPEAPSESDLNWASELEEKIQTQHYQPSPAEAQRHHHISEAFLASRAASPPPSREELQWATHLQQKAQKGYHVTPQEMSRFRDISARLAIQQQKAAQEALAKAPDLGRAPTQDELEWAQDILQRTQTQGYQPSGRELERFQMIAKARQNYR